MNLKETPNKKLKTKDLSLLTLSFIEGGTLMFVEIISTKIIAPFFGNSLYVWTAVLSTTLIGLALGYLYGGKISNKKNNLRILFTICIISSFLTITLPFYSTLILKPTLNLGLEIGVIISSLALLIPVIFLFGMVSPLIISLLSKKINKSGKTASYVYTISTLGGVIFALTTGLYLIFNFGIKNSCLIVGLILLITTLLSIALNSKTKET